MQDSKQEILDESIIFRRNLEAADPATLLLSLVQLTGERHWLDQAKPFVRGSMSYQAFMPEELRAAVCARMAEVLVDLRTSGQTMFAPPDDALLSEMMSFAAGEAVADDYIAMMHEDLTSDGLAARALGWRKPPDRTALHGT
jgi:hypothetical protein